MVSINKKLWFLSRAEIKYLFLDSFSRNYQKVLRYRIIEKIKLMLEILDLIAKKDKTFFKKISLPPALFVVLSEKYNKLVTLKGAYEIVKEAYEGKILEYGKTPEEQLRALRKKVKEYPFLKEALQIYKKINESKKA